jgi:hypothetical protein
MNKMRGSRVWEERNEKEKYFLTPQEILSFYPIKTFG